MMELLQSENTPLLHHSNTHSLRLSFAALSHLVLGLPNKKLVKNGTNIAVFQPGQA